VQTRNGNHGKTTEYINYQRAGRSDAEPIIREAITIIGSFFIKVVATMIEYKNNPELFRFKINTQMKLTGLWTALMLLYIYCDIYSFHRPGYVGEMIAGKIGLFEVSQGVLAAFSILMALPALMIPACLLLKANAVKWVNIVIGALYTLVNVGNLIGETWVYYWIYSTLEIAITIVIIIVATKWAEEGSHND
jgi:hypothetical protein